MDRKLARLAVLTAAIMFLVVQMGALVTNTGSGDGCGQSWPLCKGSFMPDWDYPAIVEFSHRAVSGLAGLLSLLLAYGAWRRRPVRPGLRGLALAGLLFVCLQGGLGAAAVLWPQPKAVLALHFGISLICFSAALLTAALLRRGQRPAASPALPGDLRRWVWTVTGFTYAVLYLGAYVRHLGASRACIGWPLCNGALVPTLYGPVGANFAHRVGAALAVLLVVRLALLSRRGEVPAAFRRMADLALVLILAQVVSGAVIALGFLNLLTQMVHSTLVTAFWGVLSLLCLETAGSVPLRSTADGPAEALA